MKFNIWENLYKNFDSAIKDKVGPGFEGPMYIERSLKAATESYIALKSTQKIPYFHKQRNTNLPSIVKMILRENEYKIKILDFGGGLGIAYMTLVEEIPHLMERIEYTIVDIPEVCRIGKDFYATKLPILYSSTIQSKTKVNLVYSSSCIQYAESWENVIDQFALLRPKYILFSDFFSSNEESFVSLQNYYESKIPHWFINLEEITKYLYFKGYTMNSKTLTNFERLGEKNINNLTNFSSQLVSNQSLNLLFKNEL